MEMLILEILNRGLNVTYKTISITGRTHKFLNPLKSRTRDIDKLKTILCFINIFRIGLLVPYLTGKSIDRIILLIQQKIQAYFIFPCRKFLQNTFINIRQFT